MDHRSRSTLGHLSAGVQKAMEMLLEAHEAADQGEMDAWQYALGINDLRRAGALDHELRMLIGAGWIAHAVETTGRQERTRRFRPTNGLALHDRSCTVVTPRGILEAAAAHIAYGRMFALHTPKAGNAGRLRPVWDKARRQLRVGRHVAKSFRQPASGQEAILDAFQRRGWPDCIEDPLPYDPVTNVKRRLNQTLKNLNRGQTLPAVHFQGDGTGTGICWSLRLEATAARLSLADRAAI